MRNKKDILPAKATHPGDIIRQQLELLNIKADVFAKKHNIEPFKLKQIIQKKRDLDVETAEKLTVLGIKTETWIKLQAQYYKDKKIIDTKHQLEKANMSNVKKKKILSSLLNFFGLA